MQFESASNTQEVNPIINENEISLQEISKILIFYFKYITSKFLPILMIGIFFGLIGFIYALKEPVRYTSTVTFVVESNKSASSGLASLAGQFGIDVGGGSGGSSLFTGDNILLFLKSKSLVRETLLTDYSQANDETLADKYSDVIKVKQKWGNVINSGSIRFGKDHFFGNSRLKDSLLNSLVEMVISNDLEIYKPEKESSYIEVKCEMQDELLSQLFSERLVDLASKRYIDSKIKIKSDNLIQLKKKSDSLANILNEKSFLSAKLEQSFVDLNPGERTVPIISEMSSREKSIAFALYAEVIKNLEFSKTMLTQEIPIIQVVDKSVPPLQKNKINELTAFFLGFSSGVTLASSFLIIFFWIKNNRLKNLGPQKN